MLFDQGKKYPSVNTPASGPPDAPKNDTVITIIVDPILSTKNDMPAMNIPSPTTKNSP